jgi:hypothetical protein
MGLVEREPAVSISTLMDNDEEFGASAIDSCIAQIMSNAEVIYVNDASTDQTCAEVEKYFGDPRIRPLLNEANASAFSRPSHRRRSSPASTVANDLIDQRPLLTKFRNA